MGKLKTLLIIYKETADFLNSFYVIAISALIHFIKEINQ